MGQIEDVRISKRRFVIQRAKELLKEMMDTVLPDSAELSEEVSASVRVMEITEWGKERLPAGPGVDESDEIIIVEGRADVISLLKNGFKNVIAINGTSVPETVKELCKQKVCTAFMDGDRGGDLIIKELASVTEIDFVTRAPDGKEVEELTTKEIHKAIRSRVTLEQAMSEIERGGSRPNRRDRPERGPERIQERVPERAPERVERVERPQQRRPSAPPKDLTTDEKKKFSEMLDDLIGTRGAYILDEKLNILGKVPTTELQITIKSLKSGVFAIILDGAVDRNLVKTAEDASVHYLVAMDAKSAGPSNVQILTGDNL